MKETIYCPMCEEQRPFRPETVSEEYEVRGEKIALEIPRLICSVCGESMIEESFGDPTEHLYAEYRREKRNKLSESWYPLAGGAVASLVFFLCVEHFRPEYPAVMPNLFAAVINISAIAIGFLGASQSILIGMQDKEIMRRLWVGGFIAKITDYLLNAIHLAFWLAALSTFGLLADPTKPKPWYMLAMCVWVGLLVASALAYYRIVSLFTSILKLGLHAEVEDEPAPKADVSPWDGDTAQDKESSPGQK